MREFASSSMLTSRCFAPSPLLACGTRCLLLLQRFTCSYWTESGLVGTQGQSIWCEGKCPVGSWPPEGKHFTAFMLCVNLTEILCRFESVLPCGLMRIFPFHEGELSSFSEQVAVVLIWTHICRCNMSPQWWQIFALMFSSRLSSIFCSGAFGESHYRVLGRICAFLIRACAPVWNNRYLSPD